MIDAYTPDAAIAPPAPKELLSEFGGKAAIALPMKPVGPVSDAFLQDDRFLVGIMGPYGSGKTTTCYKKIMLAAARQNPDRNGVRHCRVMVTRPTYAQLVTNVMADWFSYFPPSKENWNGEYLTQKIKLQMIGIGEIHLEILFRAIDDEKKAEQVMKGANLTVLWLNETDTQLRAVLRYGMPRVGRYPGTKEGGCAFSQVMCDFNAPDVDNWTYDLFVNHNLGVDDDALTQMKESFGRRFGIGFHVQPGGRTPDAENLANLPNGYYQRQLIGMSQNDIRRFVDNEFGATQHGQPVYPEFNDRFHVATAPLTPVAGVPLVIGLDGGSTPAAVICQMGANGQIRILDEIVQFVGEDSGMLAQIGPRAFAREIARVLNAKYPRNVLGELWGDPAIFYGSLGEEASWADQFAKEFGRRVKAAKVKGNRIAPRLEAVRDGLVRNAGSEPGLLLSPSCRHLRRGFNNGYVFQRVGTSATGLTQRDTPDKGPYSHVHDALQYAMFMMKRSGAAMTEVEAGPRHRAGSRGRAKFSGYSNLVGA